MDSNPVVVDMHTHFIPPTFTDDVTANPDWETRVQKRDGQPWLVHAQGFTYPLQEEFLGDGAKLADMDERGIDLSVLSLAPTLFYYWIAPEAGISFARMANESLAQAVDASSGRTVGVATVPMQNPVAAARELRYAVEELGLLGAQIGSSIEGRHLDDAAFLPFWETANELAVPIILHPYYVGSRPGLEDFYLTNILGNPLDTALAASRLIFGGALERFQTLSLVLVHGGGFLPYQLGRLDHGWKVRDEPKVKLDRRPSEYIDRFWFDSITHNDHALRWLIEFAGETKVMLGTDLPFDMADEDPVARVKRAAETEGARQLVSGDNAMKLFGLAQPIPRS